MVKLRHNCSLVQGLTHLIVTTGFCKKMIVHVFIEIGKCIAFTGIRIYQKYLLFVVLCEDDKSQLLDSVLKDKTLQMVTFTFEKEGN